MKTVCVWSVAVMFGAIVGMVCATPAWAADHDNASARSTAPPAGVARIEQASVEADGVMARAARYLEAGKLDEAAQTLQRGIDEYGDALTFTGQGHYLQTRRAAERIIAGWAESAPAALRAYRVAADTSAKALIGDEPPVTADEAALREVVDHYMLSSLGDDAALALAGMLIDRGDHGEAVSVLTRLVGQGGGAPRYPHPSVAMSDVWARIAVAAAAIGDRQRATAAIAALREAEAPDALVEALVKRLPSPDPVEAGEAAGARLTLAAALENDNEAVAGLELLWRADSGHEYDDLAAAFASPGRTAPAPRPRLVERWRAAGWHPTSTVRFVGDRMLFRAGIELVCVNRVTGERFWTSTLADGQRPWPARLSMINPAPAPADGDRPTRPGEILLFGDRMSAGFAVGEGRAYVVEPRIDNERVVIHRGRRMIPVGNLEVTLPGNRVAALDLADGRVLWRATIPSRKGGEGVDRMHADLPTHIIAEPVVWNDRLLTVIDDQGDVSLVALRLTDGRLLWRRKVCVHAPDNATDWAPIDLSIDGSTVYVSTGRGLVVAADGFTGRLLWGYPYQRGEQEAPQRVMNRAVAKLVDAGWKENRTLLVGDTVIATGADTARPMLLEAATGRPLELRTNDGGAAAREDMQYLIGEAEGQVFIGGRARVYCFDVAERAFRWSSSLGRRPATGRALLTADAVVVPVDDRLVWLDRRTGKQLGTSVVGREGDDPLGNLASDGERLLAVGIDRARAIGNARDYLAELTPRIEAGQAGALLQRARLFERQGRIDDAIDAHRRLLAAVDEGPGREAARQALIANLLKLVHDEPDAGAAADLLAEARELASGPDEAGRIDLADADRLRARGKTEQAALAYRRLARSSTHALVAVDPSDPGRRARVDAEASARLEAMTAGEQGAAVIRALQGPATKALAAIGPDAGAEELLRFVMAHPRTEAAVEAVARLGALSRDAEHLRFASVELALRRLAADPSRPESVEALHQLLRTYLAKGWASDARELLDRHAAVDRTDLPDELAGRVKVVLGSAPPDGEHLGEPPLKRSVVCDEPDARLLGLSATRALNHSTFLRNHIFVHRTDANRILRYGASDGFIAATEVGLPPDASDLAFTSRADHVLTGGVDGHLMLVLSPSRTRAIDLVSGTVAWEREADRSAVPPQLVARAADAPVDALPRFIAVGHGLFAEVMRDAATGRARVVVSDLASGETRWSREMGEGRALGVYLTDRYLVTVVARGRPAIVLYDPLTGRHVRTIESLPTPAAIEYHYREPNDRELGFSPAVVAGLARGQTQRPIVRPADDTERLTDLGLIYLHDNTIGLVAFDDRTRSWQHTFGKRHQLREVIELAAQKLLVQARSGRSALIDVATGKVHWQVQDQQFGLHFADAYLDPRAGRLHALIKTDRGGQVLVEADPTTGRLHASVKVGTLPLGAQPTSARTLASSGPYLPRFVRFQRKPQSALSLLRRSNGEVVDDAFGSSSVREALTQPPRIRGHALILATDRGVIAYMPDE